METKRITEVPVLEQAAEQTNLLVEHAGQTRRVSAGGALNTLNTLNELNKFPLFYEASEDGDAWTDGNDAGLDQGSYIGQIVLQGSNRYTPKRIWMYVGSMGGGPIDYEQDYPLWIDLLSGDAYSMGGL